LGRVCWKTNANLTFADLSFANLTRADLSNSIMLGCKGLTSIIRSNLLHANFKNALIDNQEFIRYLRNSEAKNTDIDEEPNSLNELKSKLEERGVDSKLVTKFLNYKMT
jgi:uncharacterized protein YjbI with pentapeptide repeats